MYAFLKGKVEYVTEGNIVALSCGGVGYEIYATNSVITKYGIPESEAVIYTYLQVKEDGMTLFGFCSKEEKSMFVKLVSVSGVGAKTAVAIISSMRLDTLALAIVSGDSAALSAIKGIGKKTAERIILELREKIHSADISSDLPTSVTSFSSVELDAVDALIALGLSRSESVNAVDVSMKAGNDSLEKIVSHALKSLDRRI